MLWSLCKASLGGKNGAVVEQSPPANVTRVQIPLSMPYVGWVCCWFPPLLREVFVRVLQFSPLLKNQHFQIPIRPGMVDEQPMYKLLLLNLIINHYLLFYLFIYSFIRPSSVLWKVSVSFSGNGSIITLFDWRIWKLLPVQLIATCAKKLIFSHTSSYICLPLIEEGQAQFVAECQF